MTYHAAENLASEAYGMLFVPRLGLTSEIFADGLRPGSCEAHAKCCGPRVLVSGAPCTGKMQIFGAAGQFSFYVSCGRSGQDDRLRCEPTEAL